MRSALIDTNIVSSLFAYSNPNFDSCKRIIGTRLPIVSFMTRAEILLWPKANRWGDRREQELLNHLGRFTTLYPDDRTFDLWTVVKTFSKRRGRPIETADAWIAATALQFEIPLITLNHRDFNFIDDLELILVHDPSPNS